MLKIVQGEILCARSSKLKIVILKFLFAKFWKEKGRVFRFFVRHIISRLPDLYFWDGYVSTAGNL